MSNKLSNGAKVILGALFGMIHPGKGSVSFNLCETKPSAWATDALHELVEAKLISVEPFRWGGLIFSPLVDCHPYFVWMARGGRRVPEAKMSFTEPLLTEAEGLEFQQTFLAKAGITNAD